MKQITRIGSVYKPGEPIFWKRKGGAFSPLDLFASGEEGAWYDPSDFSTMFQDDLGTIPVTAAGQTVGKILDKSGRGNHATQATEANRPVLQQDGNGKYYLGFDGVDDSLSTAAIDFTATNKMSVFSGYALNSASLYAHIVNLGDGLQGDVAGGFNIFNIDSPRLSATYRQTGDAAASYGGYGSASGAEITLSAGQVFTCLMNGDGTTYATSMPVIKNQPTDLNWQAQGSIQDHTGTFGNLPLFLGRDFSNKLNGRIYSMIVRGALSTEQEITDTETWVNGKTGAY